MIYTFVSNTAPCHELQEKSKTNAFNIIGNDWFDILEICWSRYPWNGKQLNQCVVSMGWDVLKIRRRLIYQKPEEDFSETFAEFFEIFCWLKLMQSQKVAVKDGN